MTSEQVLVFTLKGVDVVEYVLRPKAYGWLLCEEHDVLAEFELRAERRGERLGGNGVQAVFRAPFEDEDPSEAMHPEGLRLSSGWRVGLRNQFAAQPEIGRAILESVREQLEEAIARGTDGKKDLPNEFRGEGPDYWR